MAPVRSLLSREWKRESARHRPLQSISSGSSLSHTGPTDLPGFTRFVQQEASIEAELRKEQAAAAEANNEASTGNASGSASSYLPASQDERLGSVEFVRLQDVPDLASPTISCHDAASKEGVALVRRHFQNLYGTFSKDAEDVALVIVELLGPDSRAGECREMSFFDAQ